MCLISFQQKQSVSQQSVFVKIYTILHGAMMSDLFLRGAFTDNINELKHFRNGYSRFHKIE